MACTLENSITTCISIATVARVHIRTGDFISCNLHSGALQITVSAPTFVIQGDTLTDNCGVMSFPQSNLLLSFGDTVIMTSVSESYDSTAGSFTYFTAYSTIGMHPNDEGNYRCLANITHG